MPELSMKSLCTQTLLLQCYKGFLLNKNQTLRVFSRTRTEAFEMSVGYSMQEPKSISWMLLGLAILRREVNQRVGSWERKRKKNGRRQGYLAPFYSI